MTGKNAQNAPKKTISTRRCRLLDPKNRLFECIICNLSGNFNRIVALNDYINIYSDLFLNKKNTYKIKNKI